MASKKPSGLGKGLGALLGADMMETESSGSLYLPISQVESCSGQPRKHFDEESLQELADSITEIKTICSCGAKATVNARLDPQGNVLTQGSQVFLGGNDSYVAMCHRCWRKKIQSQQTS